IDEKPWVILQNEINLSLEIAIKAKQLGFKVCYSAAPFSAESINKILPYVDLLAMNETEMKELQNSSDKNVVDFGVAMTLVTLGSRGAELYI
ncbi:MAG: ribokinase, partial [Rhodobacterales bacterium]